MGGFQEHCVRRFLSKELYMGFIKLQAEKSLGRSYAGLLPFIEGLHKLGYITQEVYEAHKRKYSASLLEDNTPTLEKIEKKTQRNELVKKFSRVIKSWPTMKPKAKTYWIKKAQEHQADIPNAKLIRALSKKNR